MYPLLVPWAQYMLYFSFVFLRSQGCHSIDFWQAIDIFVFIFNLFPQKSGKRKTTDHNYYMCLAQSVKLIALPAYFSSFPKENAFQVLKKSYELLLVCNHVTRRPCWGSKQKNISSKNLHENRVQFPEKRSAFVLDHQFPDFSLTLTISKIFPDLKKFSFFPDFSLTCLNLLFVHHKWFAALGKANRICKRRHTQQFYQMAAPGRAQRLIIT